MASFQVTPCKVRDGFLVPKKHEAPLTMTSWKALCALLAPSGSLAAKGNIRKFAAPNTFVVLLKSQHGITNVVVRNGDLSGDIRGVVDRDPTFESRVAGIYRFDSVVWDDVVVEPASIR